MLAGLLREREEDTKSSGCEGIKLKYSYRPFTGLYILILEVTKQPTSVYVCYVMSKMNPSAPLPPGVYAVEFSLLEYGLDHISDEQNSAKVM